MLDRAGGEVITTVFGAASQSPSPAAVSAPVDRLQSLVSIDAAVVAAFGLGAFLFSGTALLVCRRHSGPGTTALATFSALLGAVMLAGVLLTTAVTPVGQQEIGVNVLIPLVWAGGIPWLLFALLYTGRGDWVTPRRVAGLVVPALGYLVLVAVQATVDVPQVADAAILAIINVFALFLSGMYVLGSGAVVQTSYRHGHVSLPVSAAFGVAGLLLTAAPLLSLLGLGFGVRWGYLVLATTVCAGGLLLAGIVYYTDSLDSTAVAAGTAARERAFLDLADTAFVLDDRDRIVELNDTALETFGLDRSAVLGAQFVEIVDVPVDAVRSTATEDERERARQSATSRGADRPSPPEAVGTDGGVSSLSELTRTVALETTGGVRRFDVRVSSLSDRHGRRIGSVVSFRDVTDRELREQRIAIFNRVLRHNLRNKLSVVRSATDLLSEGRDDNEQLLSAINAATEDLLSVGRQAREIEQLLDERPGQHRSIPIETLLGSAVDDVRTAHPDVAFSLSIDPGAATLEVPEVLTYAIEELLDNGAKHNDAAEPRVDVTASDTDDSITIEIVDNGPGIPEQERVAIRADDESPLEHASGLGLWSVRWAVTAIGGDIAISKADDGGSVVELSVPTDRT